MNDQESNSDRNFERLMRTSFGPETRPTPSARERLRRRLLAALRETGRPKEFPTGILALLSGLVSGLAAAGFISVLIRGQWLPWDLVLSPAGLLVLVNLSCVPIASLVIVLRRKLCPKV